MLEQYYRINKAVGVSITIDPGGNLAINACNVTIQNNQLNFEKKQTDITSIEELAKHFAAKSIIALNLSGKGVLQKQLEKTEEISQINFSTILPNANIDDFYIQNFISGGLSFVSAVRKVEADKWINKIKELGFTALMLSLGPFPVQNIVAQLNVYGNDILFNGHTILRNEQQQWTSVNYNTSALSPFPFKVESESLHEKLIISYAAAFQLVLADKVEPIQAAVPILENEFQKLISEKKLKAHGFLILSVFFLLLLINFFLFNGLNSSNATLTEQVSKSVQSTDDIQKVNEQITKEEALLKTLGWESGINKSALIDQVASLLPADITWKEVEIDPIDLSNSRSQKSIVFFNRKIRVTGNSEKIIPVNEWIARIKTKSWVKNVQLDSYTFNGELNTGQFILLIEY